MREVSKSAGPVLLAQGTLAVILVIGFGRLAFGADDSLPNPNEPATKDTKVTKLLDYLEGEYAKKTTATYWVTRGMGAISLAKSPRATATAKLLEILEKDKQEVVRLLAWQGLLARGVEMNATNFKRFSDATLAMAEKDMFKGGLRVPLIQVMMSNGPNTRWKKVWEKLFTDCSAWEPEDMPVLDALAKCVAEWQSGAMVEGMINALTQTDLALRAEYVLHRIGSSAPTRYEQLPAEVRDPMNPKRSHASWTDIWLKAQQEHSAWWKGEKAKWKEVVKPEGPVWRENLKAAYIASPMKLEEIDPEDKFWTQDLELGKADIQQFEAAFVVDATGSMGDVLDWLKHDLGRMAAAMQLVCKEPVAIGVDFYRDYDLPFAMGGGGKGDRVVKHLKMTTKLQTLEPEVTAMTADGGGDIPEAVYEGIKTAIEENNWTKRTKGASKALIVIGDAPPHSKDMDNIVALAKKSAESGMKIYLAKVTTELGRNDLSDFDTIAKAGGGSTVECEFARPIAIRFLTLTGKDMPFKTVARPEVQLLTAQSGSAATPPGEKILSHIIADAISPEYRDRVMPLSQTLLAFTAQKSVAEKRLPFPANTPAMQVGKMKVQ